MKNKHIIVLFILGFILIILGFISNFFINFKEDKKITNLRMEDVNRLYEPFLSDINNFNETRDDLYITQQKVKREDIEIKVRTYRKQLNYDLMKVLDEERKKEQEREIRIAKIEDQTERDKLDKQYGTERAEASRRIIAMNEDINKKCIEYEAHLREDKKK